MPNPIPATPAALEGREVRRQLQSYVRRLQAVARLSDQLDRKNQAARLIHKIEHRLREDTDLGLAASAGLYGANGLGPQVDDICWHIEALTSAGDGFVRDAA